MKKVAAVALAVCMMGTFANAGVVNVLFDGPVEVAQGDPAVFNITLAPQTLDGIQGADLLFWSDSTAFEVAYSAAWTGAMANVPPLGPAGIFPNDMFGGGNNPAGPVGAPILFGTITVDTSGLDLLSSHTIQIDGSQDGFSALLVGTQSEPALGSGTFRVVPEPASLALLGVGAVALLRRRRTA